MSRVHFVEKAAKDNPVAKKGESYYWWASFRGPKRFSKTKPLPSQTASNEDDADALAISEEIDAAGIEDQNGQELATGRDGWVERIREVQERVQEKFDNLPEGWQQADTGQQLEEKANGLEEWADSLEGVDIDENEKDVEVLQGYLDEMQGNCPV